MDSHIPPHNVSPYDCGCVACDIWRASRLKIGDLVLPYRLDKRKYNSSVDKGIIWDITKAPTWTWIWEMDEIALYCGPINESHIAAHGKDSSEIIILSKDKSYAVLNKTLIRCEDLLKRLPLEKKVKRMCTLAREQDIV